MAGLSKGTVITKINGISVTTSEQLIEELSYYCYGEKVKLTVLVPQEDGEYGEKEVEVSFKRRQINRLQTLTKRVKLYYIIFFEMLIILTERGGTDKCTVLKRFRQ